MPTGILDKSPGNQHTSAEFNTIKNLVDANESNIGQAQSDATAAAAAAAAATSAANAASTAAAAAQAAAANALARGNHTGTQLAATISDFQAAVSANSTVVANANKTPVPDTTGSPGILYNSATNGATLSYLGIVNEWLDGTADAALIAAIASATWTNDTATISGWPASRRHIDSNYIYVANVADTVTRLAKGSGSDAIALQGVTISGTAPTDGQVLKLVGGVWTPADESAGGGGGNEFLETVFRINNDADPTKQVRFDASGVATSTLAVISLSGNANLDLLRTDADVVAAINSELSGTGWQSGGSGSTDLSYVAATGEIQSSSGNNAIVTLADGTNRGLMSSAHFTIVENAIQVDGTGLVAGDMFYYNGTDITRDPAEIIDGPATTISLASRSGSSYGLASGTPCTAASYTVSGPVPRGNAYLRVQNNTSGGPAFTLAGGTVVKVDDWTNYDTTNINHITLIAQSATLVYAHLSGVES